MKYNLIEVGKNGTKTTLTVNEGTGLNKKFSGEAQAENPYASFLLALDRASKQLRRFKNKLKSHHSDHKAA